VGEAGWAVVLPVKGLGTAKSRLRGALTGVPHERLALALAQDTVAAAVACEAVATVVVVTDDPTAATALRAVGARVVPDRPDAGLNAALTHGAQLAAGATRPVAALTADLPALRPAELAGALRAAAASGGRAYVADAAGTGTTLLAAAAGVPLDPRFGPGSAAAHTRSGARPLPDAGPTLRRDVDTMRDLAAAAALGLGAYTSAVLGRYGAGMQGTVATYDAQTRSGTLLLDDGTELAFPTAAFDASGLRLLRLGQRVRVEQDGDGEVVRVTLPTL
jgi:2-phospho-L-lactate guanylyltransferase